MYCTRTFENTFIPKTHKLNVKYNNNHTAASNDSN